MVITSTLLELSDVVRGLVYIIEEEEERRESREVRGMLSRCCPGSV